ncbi:MFS transporter-like protein [Xylaria telfairii]|nr:MFS transporter-like protein [Xylaria telfairii]
MDGEKVLSNDMSKSNIAENKFQTSSESIDVDAQLSRKLDHKFDRHIVPWIFGIWRVLLHLLFAFIDRSNIGNAKIIGLPEELGISTGTTFNVALLVFYIPCILVDVPSNWIGNTTFLGFTHSLADLIVGCLLLGLFEGGLLGGIIVYLAMFYRRHQILKQIGYFYCAAPLSGAFGGLLATGLAKIQYGGYNLEGIITTLFGIVFFFVMPHTPADAPFLTEEERVAALLRMKMDSHGATKEEDVNQEKFDWHWSFSLFLPTIISGLEYESTQAQLFTVPPNLGAVMFILFVTRVSDYLKVRGPFMAMGCLIAIAGYIMLLATKNNAVRYSGTFLVATGVFPNSVLVMGRVSNNMAPHFVRATGIGFMIAFANTSAFVSTFIYLPKDKPDYTLGHSISLGAVAICLFLVFTQVTFFTWENGKRAGGHRDHRLTQGRLGRLGHDHPVYRYTI